MSSHTPPPTGLPRLVDWAFVGALVALLVRATYQPAFFGDEIGALHVSAYFDNAFWPTYDSLNSYKPRLLYNAAWAAFGTFGATRALVATTFALALAVCGGTLLVFMRPYCSRAIGWLAVALVLISRFGATVYSDYLSGTIEAWSLALLLLSILVASRSGWWVSGRFDARTLALVLALLVGATFVHERYAAAAMAFGLVVASKGALSLLHRGDGGRLVWAGIAIALIPAALFAAATYWLADAPLTTGTSGREVSLNLGTLRSAGTYLLNVAFGMNFGKVWFVGSLNELHPAAKPVFATCGIALLVAWLVPVFRRRDFRRPSDAAVLALMAALALVGVASLPGIERQEMRWMFPVQCLLVGFVAMSYRGVARVLLLVVLLSVNGYYLLNGGMASIFAVSSSRTAGEIARQLNAEQAGSRGLFLQASEPDTTWILTGGPYLHNDARSAAVFCSLNVRNDACVAPSGEAAAPAGAASFGYVVVPDQVDGSPWIDSVQGAAFEAMRDPSRFDMMSGQSIGGTRGWEQWRWVEPPAKVGSQVALSPGEEGNIPVPVTASGRLFVVYTARAAGASSAIRMQVIWTDAAGAQVGAEGAAASVPATASNHAMVVHVPTEATTGYVYVIVPADAGSPLLLSNVRMIRQDAPVR